MRITRKELLVLVLLFVISRAVLFAAGTWANLNLEANEGPEFTHLLDGGPALDMWYRWDAGFYATIATEGYKWFNQARPDGDIAFLPLYPTAVGAVMRVSTCGFTPYLSTCATVAGLIVSNAALFAAVVLFYDLIKQGRNASTALRAVVLLLCTPAAIFFGGVYTESLFILLAILTFWLLERQHWGWAIGAACLAALTRSVGIALVPALLWWAWFHTPAPQRRIRVLSALMPGIVFGVYVLLAGLHIGDPLAYFKSYEIVWERDVTRAPWETIAVYLSGQVRSLYGFDPSWIDFIAFVLGIVGSIAVLRRNRSWGLFALAALLIPFASGTLSAMPRFVSVVFPLYILLADWTSSRWRFVVVLGLSGLIALFFVARFVTWRWIA